MRVLVEHDRPVECGVEIVRLRAGAAREHADAHSRRCPIRSGSGERRIIGRQRTLRFSQHRVVACPAPAEIIELEVAGGFRELALLVGGHALRHEVLRHRVGVARCARGLERADQVVGAPAVGVGEDVDGLGQVLELRLGFRFLVPRRPIGMRAVVTPFATMTASSAGACRSSIRSSERR